jgi:hypothetical protein
MEIFGNVSVALWLSYALWRVYLYSGHLNIIWISIKYTQRSTESLKRVEMHLKGYSQRKP